MKLDGCLSEHNINPHLMRVEYAVRGALPLRAEQIQRELDKGVIKPFSRVIHANIGDCHALGQKPITFIRQVLSLVSNPDSIEAADVPEDVKDRARELLADCTSGSVGSYSPPAGLRSVRACAAEFLRARDHVPALEEDILLGAGATDLIRAVLQLINCPVDGKPPAVMVPVPQYPVFSGLLSELGVHRADYLLAEDQGWALTEEELERCWRRHAETHAVRAIVVINPGNPTGQVLSRENIEAVVRFAHAHGLFVLADEVYQDNIVSKPFHSFRKVIHEMGLPYSDLESCSVLTLSKGYAAECGLRAACAELRVRCAATRHAVMRTRALSHCPSVLGQCALHCVLRPPAPGSASQPLHSRERARIHRTLCARAAAATRALNDIPGYTCNTIDGAMFAFPRVEIPARAQAAAAAVGQQPDEFYCLRLLEETGICVVPGSGFGQAAGTFHFRTTILHERQEFQHMMDEIRRFHLQFLREFADDQENCIQ